MYVLGTEVTLKQWKSEAATLCWGHYTVVWRRYLPAKVGVVIVPVKSGVSTSYGIGFRGKEVKDVMV